MTTETTAELYYPLVTEAIRKAETLEDLGAPGTAQAYLDVSLLEERIAHDLPAADPEGALARRGAVRAALSARNFERARQLIDRYLAEAESRDNGELREEMSELRRQVEASSTARFPHAMERYGPFEIQRVARAFIQQAAPFPIG